MKKLLCVFFCVMLAALSAVVFTGGKDTQKNYIKYVEFNVTKDALQNAVDLDIQTHDDDRHTDCITTLAYLGAKYGGDFTKYKYSDMTDFCRQNQKSAETVENLNKGYEIFQTTTLRHTVRHFRELSMITKKKLQKALKKTTACAGFHRLPNLFRIPAMMISVRSEPTVTQDRTSVMILWRLSAHLLWRLSRERLKLWAGTGTVVGESESVLPTKNAIGTMPT